MDRRLFLGTALAAAGFFGCGGSPRSTARTLTTAELEADMAERLHLRDVALTDQGGGRFTGTGTDAQGRRIELEVTQEERRRTWKAQYQGPDASIKNSGGISW
jgi:hypothetical protein